jgi:SPP1 family predicted phage head-tail adaptor
MKKRDLMGQMRQRIALQAKTITKSEGIPLENWTTVATVWAAVSDISGKEYFQAGALQSEVTTRIKIRYRTGITTSMRVLYGSRVFQILSVIDKDERHYVIELMCNYILLILLIKEKKLLKDAELIWDNPILMVPLAVVSTENGQKRRVNEQTVLSVFGILLGNTIYKWGTDGIKGVRLSWVTIEKAHMQLTFGDGTKTVRIRLLHGMLLAVELGWGN